MPADVEIVQLEPRLTAVVRKAVAPAQMPTAQREARRTLEATLSAAGVDPVDRPLTVWRPPVDGKIDYAPGLFVPAAFDAVGDVSLFTLPSGRAAHLRLRGPYDQLPAAWPRLFEACASQGLSLAGLNWEIYTAPGPPSEAIETDLYALLA